MSIEEERKGLIGAYGQRDFDASPATYSDKALQQKIFNATGLEGFKEIAKVLDIMSGPGKVGLGLQERASGHNYFFLDFSEPQLRKIPGDTRILGDSRQLPIQEDGLDVVVARYAIKDLSLGEQPGVLAQIYDVVKPGGTLVIAEMVSPKDGGAKGWLNTHHALKQKLGGRNSKREGICHIPTEKEWLSMLDEIGFQAEVFDRYVSHVVTTDWVKGKQITSTQLLAMNENILDAPHSIRQVFNIREEAREVKIDYPVLILKATKPDQSIITNLTS